jgi:L-aminopeptidase/D-esterase-like protein
MNPTLYPGQLGDVEGLAVGHFTDQRRPTGCSVVLSRMGAVAGVDVRGAAPGTRETDVLAPGHLVEHVHALLFSGGSAWGLDAASGVMRYLEAQGVGFETPFGKVPIVPAAVIFDLGVGDPAIRPDAAAGYAACLAAGRSAAQGSVGAGAGARVGKLLGMPSAMKGGVGMASLQAGGWTVAALVVCNALGDVIDPSNGQIVAGARDASHQEFARTVQTLLAGGALAAPLRGNNTTVGVVATDAQLSKAQARRLAQVSHDGLARTINPVHTPYDGDTLFALATGTQRQTADMLVLSVLAAEATARATLNAVRSANA